MAKWPNFDFSGLIKFFQCNISHSSFFEIYLAEITIESCKAHNVDFRSTNLSNANLAYNDFQDSQFGKTDLTSADFTESRNYQISVYDNTIKNAKFSLPEALALLDSLEINIS